MSQASMKPLKEFHEFRKRLIACEGYADGKTTTHMLRFKAHKADIAAQLNPNIDHGDIHGDNYSRSMREAHSNV